MAAKKLSPQEVKTYKEFLNLQLSAVKNKRFNVLVDEKDILILTDKKKYKTKNGIIMPKKDFDALIKFYTTKQIQRNIK